MIRLCWEGRVAGTNERLGRARDGHLYRTKRYAAYRESLAWSARCARDCAAPMFDGPVAVRIEYELDRARDADGAVKPTLDALQDAGVFRDDNQVAQLEVVKYTHARGARDSVTIQVEALKAPGRQA